MPDSTAGAARPSYATVLATAVSSRHLFLRSSGGGPASHAGLARTCVVRDREPLVPTAPPDKSEDAAGTSRHSFQSVYHPGTRPAAAVYSQALARPIGACVVPVMIGAATVVLQGKPAWGFLAYGLPGALVVATAWTHFTLRRRFAELHLRPGEAAVRSVHDILGGRDPEWQSLHSVQVGRWDVKLSVGWRSYVLRAPEWPEFAQLRSVAEEAASAPPSATPSRS